MFGRIGRCRIRALACAHRACVCVMSRRCRRAERCDINDCARNRGADAMRAMPFTDAARAGDEGTAATLQENSRGGSENDFRRSIFELFSDYFWTI
eukprot:4405660-Pyramimonas_sp.AAC.2